ncbi:hypothetical protein JHK82_019597 [Glycine max]|uniref:Reverse transcriptase zinc-binding domain-containing protein n=2 Tax=Glycine subgen. Soja TaxID=1462606 RepID=A0A0R0J756_SOYBN|nr:hypothetical protein JHK87_019476 [Glycine soja]KAG5023696.1 hypothetical protein JHK85_020038 [Glycine max]KAG5038774.1 hypothetical protein JHK86_019614 [Glycine max]KAG5143902.1 hypothetical protein JHK82_019597 [Glycine max]KAH1088212.1 hypothetical protein GYH30_019315 [Glycine max]
MRCLDIPDVETSCVLCREMAEDYNHLFFFQCIFAYQLYRKMRVIIIANWALVLEGKRIGGLSSCFGT